MNEFTSSTNSSEGQIMNQPMTVTELIIAVWDGGNPLEDRDYSVRGELKIGRYDSVLTEREKRENQIWIRGGWLYFSILKQVEQLIGGHTIGNAIITGRPEQESMILEYPVVFRDLRSYEFERTLETLSGESITERATGTVPLFDKREFQVVHEDQRHVVLRWDERPDEFMLGLDIRFFMSDFLSIHRLVNEFNEPLGEAERRVKATVNYLFEKANHIMDRTGLFEASVDNGEVDNS